MTTRSYCYLRTGYVRMYGRTDGTLHKLAFACETKFTEPHIFQESTEPHLRGFVRELANVHLTEDVHG